MDTSNSQPLSCLTPNCLVSASLCGPSGYCTVCTLANNLGLEFLVQLPNGFRQWVKYTPDMLDNTDEDDRPVEAAIRAAHLPVGTHGVLDRAGRQVRRNT